MRDEPEQLALSRMRELRDTGASLREFASILSAEGTLSSTLDGMRICVLR